MNKPLIEKLTEYFLEQESASIAKSLAGAMLDIYRFMNLDTLDSNETDNLFLRSKNLCEQLVKFAKDGPSGPIIVRIKNSEDDE